MARTRRSWAVRLLTWCCWGYCVLMVSGWVLLHYGSDTWWPAFLLIYGPRWPLLVPVALLAAGALALRRRLLWPCLLSLVVVAGPVMDLRLPYRQVFAGKSARTSIRVLTCNIGKQSTRAEALQALVVHFRPDIVLLQEWDANFDLSLFDESKWHLHRGKGLLLASRFPIRDVKSVTDEPGWRDIGSRYQLETSAGLLYVVNVHLATPRDGLDALLHHRWRGPWKATPELRANAALREWESATVRKLAAEVEGPLLVAGDLNMPVESSIYRRDWSSLANAFNQAGVGYGHTKFTRLHGVRIDQILVGPELRCRSCWVGPDVGSDHRPLLADLELTAAP